MGNEDTHSKAQWGRGGNEVGEGTRFDAVCVVEHVSLRNRQLRRRYRRKEGIRPSRPDTPPIFLPCSLAIVSIVCLPQPLIQAFPLASFPSGSLPFYSLKLASSLLLLMCFEAWEHPTNSHPPLVMNHHRVHCYCIALLSRSFRQSLSSLTSSPRVGTSKATPGSLRGARARCVAPPALSWR